MSNQVTPLEAALARAEEAEANMKLAAQYGQELLEKMNKSEKMQVQLEQERHNLKLQLQSKESTEKAMQDEINRKKITNLSIQSNLGIRNSLISNKLVLRKHFQGPIANLLHRIRNIWR